MSQKKAEVDVKVVLPPAKGAAPKKEWKPRGRKQEKDKSTAKEPKSRAGSEGRRVREKSVSRKTGKFRIQKAVVMPEVDKSDKLDREIAAVPRTKHVFTVSNTVHAEIDPWVVTGASGAANVWALAKWHIARKVQAINPMFFQSGTSDDLVSPQSFSWALSLLILDYLRRAGVLALNTTYNAGGYIFSIPVFADSTPVPVSLAYLLHQCAPYVKDGADMRFAFNGTGTFTAIDATDASMTSTKTDLSYAPYSVMCAAADPTSGEIIVAAGTAETIAQVLAKAQNILSRLRDVLETVELGKIGLTAPDASAYALLVYNNTDNVSTITCSVKDFDPEMAYLFGFRNATVQPAAYKKLPPEVQCLWTSRNVWGTTGTIRRVPMVLSAVEHGFALSYRHQPLKKALWYSRYGKIRQIMIDVCDMDLTVWHSYVGTLIAKLAQELNNLTVPLNAQQVYLLAITADSILLNTLHDFAHIIDPIGNFPVVSSSFGDAKVTASMRNFQASLGTVIRSGQLTLNLPIGSCGQFIASSKANTLPSAGANNPYYGICTLSGYAAAAVIGAGWTSSSVLAAATTVSWVAASFPTTTAYALTPTWNSAKALVDFWNQKLEIAGQNNSTGAEFKPALFVQDRNIITGRVNGISYVDITSAAYGGVVASLDAGTMGSMECAITGVTSMALLTKPALESVLVTAIRLGSTDRQTVPFSTQFGPVYPVRAMLNADSSAELVEAEGYKIAVNIDDMVSVGGAPLDLTPSNPITEALSPLYAAAIQGILPQSIELGTVLARDIPAYADNQFANLFPDIKPGSMLAGHLAEVFARAQKNPRKKMTFGRALKQGLGAVSSTVGEVLGQVVGKGIHGVALGLGSGASASMGRV